MYKYKYLHIYSDSSLESDPVKSLKKITINVGKLAFISSLLDILKESKLSHCVVLNSPYSPYSHLIIFSVIQITEESRLFYRVWLFFNCFHKRQQPTYLLKFAFLQEIMFSLLKLQGFHRYVFRIFL